MTTIAAIATGPIVYAGDIERCRWQDEMRRREAMDLAFLFHRMVREGNVEATLVMMNEGRGDLRRAIRAHDKPANLLCLAYDRLGEEYGKAIFTFVTKRDHWDGIGCLLRDILRSGAPAPKALLDEVVTRYRALYVTYEEWERIPWEDVEDYPYPPVAMWKAAVEVALAHQADMVDCLLPLAALGIDGMAAAGRLWEYPAVSDNDASTMPVLLRERLTTFYAEHIGR